MIPLLVISTILVATHLIFKAFTGRLRIFRIKYGFKEMALFLRHKIQLYNAILNVIKYFKNDIFQYCKAAYEHLPSTSVCFGEQIPSISLQQYRLLNLEM